MVPLPLIRQLTSVLEIDQLKTTSFLRTHNQETALIINPNNHGHAGETTAHASRRIIENGFTTIPLALDTFRHRRGDSTTFTWGLL